MDKLCSLYKINLILNVLYIITGIKNPKFIYSIGKELSKDFFFDLNLFILDLSSLNEYLYFNSVTPIFVYSKLITEKPAIYRDNKDKSGIYL